MVFYKATENEKIKVEAEKYTNKIESILAKPVRSHDLGFVFNSRYRNGYRLIKYEKYKQMLTITLKL